VERERRVHPHLLSIETTSASFCRNSGHEDGARAPRARRRTTRRTSVQVDEVVGCSWVIGWRGFGDPMCRCRFASVPVPASRYRLKPSCCTRYPLVAVPSFGTYAAAEDRQLHSVPPSSNLRTCSRRSPAQEPFGQLLEARRVAGAQNSWRDAIILAASPSCSSVAYTSLAPPPRGDQHHARPQLHLSRPRAAGSACTRGSACHPPLPERREVSRRGRSSSDVVSPRSTCSTNTGTLQRGAPPPPPRPAGTRRWRSWPASRSRRWCIACSPDRRPRAGVDHPDHGDTVTRRDIPIADTSIELQATTSSFTFLPTR